MATWVQMLATSVFIYQYCLISADFLTNSTFLGPSHAHVFMGGYIPSTNRACEIEHISLQI